MIIKIIPETDLEKASLKEEEHSGVKDFFICGSKVDADSDYSEFHTWSGKYKFLVGSLYYFMKQIEEEQTIKEKNQKRPNIVNASKTLDIQDVKDVINLNQPTPIIKRGSVTDDRDPDNPDAVNVIDISNLNKE